MNTSLVNWTALRKELDSCSSIPDLKILHDKAKAIELFLRDQDESLVVQNDIAEHRIRVERKLGDFLRDTVTHKSRPKKSVDSGDTNGKIPEGISRDQSSKWQRVSAIPPAVFEKTIADIKEEKAELSTAGVLRLGTQRPKPKATEEVEDEIEDELDDEIEPGNARTAFMLRADQVRTFARDCAKLSKMFKMDSDALEVVRYALLDWKNLSKLLREQSCKRNRGSRRGMHSVSKSCRVQEK